MTPTSEAKPMVSVIIIFLNAEPYIEETLESVFAQTFTDWDLHLVDDGSTDGSTDIARAYQAKYPDRVFYHEHEGHGNKGMSASRNVGVRQSKGEWIAQIDADDVWVPAKLEEQLRIVEKHPEVDMVCGSTRYWYEWTGRPEDAGADRVILTGGMKDEMVAPPRLMKEFYPLGPGSAPCPSDLLLRRAIVEKVGGWEEEFTGMYEDQVFLSKIYLVAHVYVAAATWLHYRRHPDSCMELANQDGKYAKFRRMYLDWFADYLKEHDPGDREIRRLLDRALSEYNHPLLHKVRTTPARVLVKQAARQLLPPPVFNFAKEQWRQHSRPGPAVGRVNFGDLRRTEPLSNCFGFDRGKPVDRYYIEKFHETHSGDIQGHVLEIGGNDYTLRYGGSRVTKSDVLHVTEGNPKATIVGDLTDAPHIPDASFDCILLTQTLQFIYDVSAALRTLHRILKPEGVLLATFSGISHTGDETWGPSWFWNFTEASAQRRFEEAFPAANLKRETFGNVLAAISLLQGVAAGELKPEELDVFDARYIVTIGIRAQRESA